MSDRLLDIVIEVAKPDDCTVFHKNLVCIQVGQYKLELLKQERRSDE